MKEYVMYKGEDLLSIGTLDEIAEERGIDRETVRFYTTPAYGRRVAKRKNARNYITVTRMEEE